MALEDFDGDELDGAPAGTLDPFDMDAVLDALDAEVESFVEDVVEGGYE